MKRYLAQHHRALAVLVGSALVVSGCAMVTTPGALVLAGVALIGFFGIEFRIVR